MKKLLFGIIAVTFFGSYTANAKSINPQLSHIENLLKKKTFEGDITLSGGCHVHYVITVDYSILTLSVNSIHGTFTMSGNCSGTQSFRGTAQTDEKGNVIGFSSDAKGDELQSEEFISSMVKILDANKEY